MKGSGELDPSGATRDPSLSPQLVWLSSPPGVSDRLPFISHMSTSISIYNLSIYLSICLSIYEMGSCYVAQAGLDPLGCRDLPTSVSQAAKTAGTCHHTRFNFSL
jgi:hypothetical protein